MNRARDARFTWRFLMLAGLATSCASGKGDGGLTAVPCPGGCPSGQVCFKNACVANCAAAGGLVCASACVDPLDDDLNCGGCGIRCSSPQFCVQGVCAGSCPTGLNECSDSHGGGFCTDLLSDSSNCGTCGNACTAGEICADAGCAGQTACPTGQTLCNGGNALGLLCVDVQSDAAFCGSCSIACVALEQCVDGGCVCPEPFQLCATPSGANTCADLQSDADNCGRCGDSCGTLGACTGGACSCNGGFTQCPSDAGSVCVDVTADAQNCGACGQACVQCEGCSETWCTAMPFLVASPPLPFEGYDAGIYPSSVAIGDFNGDGHNDLAVVGVESGGFVSKGIFLEVRFGDGAGNLSAPASYLLWQQSASPTMAVGGLDPNGRRQLVIAALDGQQSVSGFLVVTFLLDGGVQPQAFASSANETFPPGLAVADFNSDGLTDVAILNPSTGIDVFYGNSDGGFDNVALQGADAFFAPRSIAYLPTFGQGPSGSCQIAAGDLDGDGRTDLAIISSAYSDGGYFAPDQFVTLPIINATGVFLQTADGGLGPLGPQTVDLTFPVFYQAPAVVSGRLVLGTPGQIDVVSDGGLVDGFPLAISGATVAAGADMNQDAISDLLVLGANTSVVSQGSVAVSLGYAAVDAGDWAFGQPAYTYAGIPTDLPTSIAVGDLNGDGRPDVAVVGTGPYAEIAILLNQCAP